MKLEPFLIELIDTYVAGRRLEESREVVRCDHCLLVQFRITSKKAPKRRRFLEGLIAGKSMRRAAVDAGYTQSMADNAGRKILPAALAEFQEELAKVGLNGHRLRVQSNGNGNGNSFNVPAQPLSI